MCGYGSLGLNGCVPTRPSCEKSVKIGKAALEALIGNSAISLLSYVKANVIESLLSNFKW